MTINANERIEMKGTMEPSTGKPLSYRAGFFSYESFISPDTNGWYDEDGELNAELITSLEFAYYDSEAPILWEESDGLSAKDKLEDRINDLSIEELFSAEQIILDSCVILNQFVGNKNLYNLLLSIGRRLAQLRAWN